MYKTRFTLPIAIILAALHLLSPAAHAINIPAGVDYFRTQDASVDLTGIIPGVGTVPLTSFFPDNALFSLPTIVIEPPQFQLNWVDRHGNQVGPDSIHRVGRGLVLSPGIVIPPVTNLPDPADRLFDTIVRRNADVTPTPGGATVPIEIVWLSLMSVDPITIDIGGTPTLVDLYVGLNDPDNDPNTPNQIEGKMQLTSTVPNGTGGTADIGLKGVTSDIPTDPSFLGLPVTYDVLFVPAGVVNPGPNNVIARQNGLQSVFHGDSLSPSGVFVVVPEPSALLLFSIGAGRLSAGRLSDRGAGPIRPAPAGRSPPGPACACSWDWLRCGC